MNQNIDRNNVNFLGTCSQGQKALEISQVFTGSYTEKNICIAGGVSEQDNLLYYRPFQVKRGLQIDQFYLKATNT